MIIIKNKSFSVIKTESSTHNKRHTTRKKALPKMGADLDCDSCEYPTTAGHDSLWDDGDPHYSN